MANHRNFYLDLVRVLALFCVIWCHINFVQFDSYLMEKIKWFFGKCGVPLFFMVSGYLAFPLRKALTPYFKSKINRVVIPLIAWTLIYAITEYAGNNPVVLGRDILNEGSAHLWFIYVIIGLYLIVPILNPFVTSTGRKILKFYLLIWAFTTLFPLIISVYNIPYSEHSCLYTLNSFYGYTGYFILGYYYKLYSNTRLYDWKTIILFLATSTILIGVYFFVFKCQTVVVSDYKSLPILLYSVAMFGLLKYISPYMERSVFRSMITTLSVYSFGIYLCHMLTIRYLFPLMPEINSFPDLLTTALFVIVDIAISFCIVYPFSKFRYTRFLFG